MTAPPPIETPALLLRYFVPEDAPKVFRMSRESGMKTWIPDQVYADEQTAREVLDYLIVQYRSPKAPVQAPYVLGICLREPVELIGHVGLSPLNGQVEIGYAVEEKHQGHGLASAAVTAMSEWGLQYFGLSHILGIVHHDNAASCRVLERAGFALVDETARQLHGRDGLVRTYRKESSAG
jgi:ribosomal-protein-alanine N-acetyltransferase